MDKELIEGFIDHHNKEAVKADNLFKVLKDKLYAKVRDNHLDRAEEYRNLL